MPKPDPSKYVSHPPVYPVGPPIWLHPDWPNIGEPKPPPPITPATPPRKAQRDLQDAVARRSCPSWTLDPNSGCSCTGLCGREDRPLQVSIADCIACIRSNPSA